MKKETKIALTAIVAIVLLFVGLNFLKGINVFKSTNTYYVKFKDVAGLAVSNPVYANGYPVGIVRTINYDYNRGEYVVVGIELDDEMRVPKQTRAELETELMGGVKMLLVLGPNPANNIGQGDTGDPALAATLHNAKDITDNLKQTSVQLNAMMQKDIPQMVGHLKQTSINAERLTANLAALDVQSTLNSVNATLESAQRMSESLGNISSSLDQKMKSNDNSLGLFLNDRGVYDNLNSTLRNADSLMIDLKAHPKRYVHFSVFGKKDK